MAYNQVPDSQTFATQVPLNRFAAQEVFKQTVSFEKAVSFTAPNVLVPATLAAAGSTQANGAAIPLAALVIVTGANGTLAAVLPVAPAGTVIRVYNPTAQPLPIFPHSGGDINDATQDAAVTLENKSLATFINVDGVTWAATFVANT